jgi:hypothetical protein
MTHEEFNKLPRNEQIEITFEQGVQNDHRKNDNHYSMFYRLHNFFVEIVFQKDTDDVIDIKSHP